MISTRATTLSVYHRKKKKKKHTRPADERIRIFHVVPLCNTNKLGPRHGPGQIRCSASSLPFVVDLADTRVRP